MPSKRTSKAAPEPTPPATPTIPPAIPAIPAARVSELPPEWRAVVSGLHSGAAQLVERLAALEAHSQIGPEAAKAYAGWVERVRAALATITIHE